MCIRAHQVLESPRKMPPQEQSAFAGELLSGSDKGTVSIFDLNHLAEPVATLRVCLLESHYTQHESALLTFTVPASFEYSSQIRRRVCSQILSSGSHTVEIWTGALRDFPQNH